jgi:hypothetical protein
VRHNGVMRRRTVFYGAAGMTWTICVYAAAVLLSSGTDGENVGKFVGTVFSGVAFIPPVWLFMKWYRRNEGRSVSRRPQTLHPQDPAETVNTERQPQ